VVDGDADKLAPVPTNVPPQLTVYHLHEAPVPRLPPVTVKVELPPLQTVPLEAVAPVGAVEAVFIVTETLVDEDQQDPLNALT
jgi:hypothetical protein